MAKPLLFIFWGESNAGGTALNSEAPPGQLGDRPSLKILNNVTLSSFDTLHISTIGDGLSNTHVGHVGFEDFGPVHGWELPLVNRVDNEAFGERPVRLAKCAQGGSKVFHWEVGASYSANGNIVNVWATFVARVDAAKALLITQYGEAPELVFFLSLGINDAITGFAPASWKLMMIELRNRVRTRYGNAPVIMTRFDSVTSVNMSGYNVVITEIANEEPTTYMVSSEGAGMKDNYHWNHEGITLVGDRLIDKYLEVAPTITGPTTTRAIKFKGRRFKLVH